MSGSSELGRVSWAERVELGRASRVGPGELSQGSWAELGGPVELGWAGGIERESDIAKGASRARSGRPTRWQGALRQQRSARAEIPEVMKIPKTARIPRNSRVMGRIQGTGKRVCLLMSCSLRGLWGCGSSLPSTVIILASGSPLWR